MPGIFCLVPELKDAIDLKRNCVPKKTPVTCDDVGSGWKKNEFANPGITMSLSIHTVNDSFLLHTYSGAV